jgi:hypothetical protein
MCRNLLCLLLMLVALASTTCGAKVELMVCQGPFCSKHGCKAVLLAAQFQPGMTGKSAPCFGKAGCTTAFPKPAVTVSAKGMGVRNLQGCENPFTAKKRVDGIAKEFGL